VEFEPQKSGMATGRLWFHSNAADSSLSAVLTGNGTAAQHNVTLEWSASVTRVKGYNVYRSEAPSLNYSRLNSALDSQTGFTDVSVESGRTYYYVTTAVSTAGVESSYSNRVEAIIP
jgi:fibronectin type 3 domain-containing protein